MGAIVFLSCLCDRMAELWLVLDATSHIMETSVISQAHRFLLLAVL